MRFYTWSTRENDFTTVHSCINWFQHLKITNYLNRSNHQVGPSSLHICYRDQVVAFVSAMRRWCCYKRADTDSSPPIPKVLSALSQLVLQSNCDLLASFRLNYGQLFDYLISCFTYQIDDCVLYLPINNFLSASKMMFLTLMTKCSLTWY